MLKTFEKLRNFAIFLRPEDLQINLVLIKNHQKMKKLFVLLSTLLVLCVAGFAQEVKFKETVHDFGDIIYKGDASYEFEFKNTGKEPLILTTPKSSCGCTVAEWPQEPILPGKSDKITLIYKNTHKTGSFSKSVAIFSNAKENNEVKLQIKGRVLPEQN